MVNSRSASSPVIPAVAAIVGIALALIAQYGLDSLADSSTTWHQIQHGTLFVAGVIVGYGALALYQSSRKRA